MGSCSSAPDETADQLNSVDLSQDIRLNSLEHDIAELRQGLRQLQAGQAATIRQAAAEMESVSRLSVEMKGFPMSKQERLHYNELHAAIQQVSDILRNESSPHSSHDFNVS